MPSQDLRAILIILAAIVVIGILVALIGYPMLILVALLATFAVFAVMILMSVEDVGQLARRIGLRTDSRRQPLYGPDSSDQTSNTVRAPRRLRPPVASSPRTRRTPGA